MKKFVLKLDLQDDKAKQKAMKTVSTLSGIDSISMDVKEKKLTAIGTVDPVSVVSKLRKYWPTDIISLGPAEEPKKKEEEAKKEEEPKKEEPKKEDEAKKEETMKEEPKKEEEEEPKKEEEKTEEEKKKEAAVLVPDPVLELVKAYKASNYNPYTTRYYYVPSVEENPNVCVIC